MALERIAYPRDQMEVIVVDDGSAHSPTDVVQRHSHLLPLRLLQQPRGGPARARNAGAHVARGSYLVFVDDDCAAAPELLNAFKRQGSAAVPRALGGETVNALPTNVFSHASQELISFLYAFYDVTPSSNRFFTTSNLAVPRQAFVALNGFDESFPLAGGEDRDLCERWLEAGFELVHVPDAIVYHRHPLSLWRFARQHFAYGRGACHLQRARIRRGAQPFAFERKGFYPGMFWFPFTRGHGLRALPIATLFVLAQVMYLAGYLSEGGSPVR